MLTVLLRGELDLTNASNLRLPGPVSPRVSAICLDVRQLSFCDVAGLRALHRLATEHTAAGRSVSVVGARPYFRKIARITGLTAELLQDA